MNEKTVFAHLVAPSARRWERSIVIRLLILILLLSPAFVYAEDAVVQREIDDAQVAADAQVNEIEETIETSEEKIDKAIEEAKFKLEQKIVKYDVSDYRAEKTGDIVLDEGPYVAAMAEEGWAPVEKSIDEIVDALVTMMPKKKSESSEANVALQKASQVYRNRENYLEAYELADRVLKLDPGNKFAENFKTQIHEDLDEYVEDMVPYDREYQTPDGFLKYKVAISDGLVTLEEAVDVSIANNLMLASMRKKLDGARQKVLEAKRAVFPTLAGEISASGGILGGTGYTGEAFKLNVSQPIYYGGELIFTIKQTEATLEASRLEYEKERSAVVMGVGEAYRALVNADYNAAFQFTLIEDLKVYRDRSVRAHALNLIPDIEILEVESTYNQASYQKAAAESNLKLANLGVYQAMGIDGEEQVPVNLSLEFDAPDVDLERVSRVVRENNYDIRMKLMSTEVAYYAMKVFDAKRMPRVDMRGSLGWQGEVQIDHTTTPDVEDEKYLGINVSVPWGPHTAEYSYSRRFWGPTVSSFLGSEDWKHNWKFNWMDNLENLTEEENARADYLKAQADLKNERMEQDAESQNAYFDYENALLQIEASSTKIKFREKQITIFKHTTALEEAKVTELMGEMASLAEEKYSRVTAISSAKDALAKMKHLAGDKEIYGQES